MTSENVAELEAYAANLISRIESKQRCAAARLDSLQAATHIGETRYGLWRAADDEPAAITTDLETPTDDDIAAYTEVCAGILQRHEERTEGIQENLKTARILSCAERLAQREEEKAAIRRAARAVVQHEAGVRYALWLREEGYARLVLRAAAVAILTLGCTHALQRQHDYTLLSNAKHPRITLPKTLPSSPNKAAALMEECLEEERLVRAYRGFKT